MGNILLKNILFSGKECDILIKGNRISRISEDMTDLPASTEVVDCTRKVALPGFVNMHTHAGM